MQNPRDLRKEAWSAAKLAVRAYARNPTQTNADQVIIASQKIRQLGAVPLWHQMQWRWLTGRSEPRPKEYDLTEERICRKPMPDIASQPVSAGIAAERDGSVLNKLQRAPKQRIQTLANSSK
jgi:hypothetical protein